MVLNIGKYSDWRLPESWSCQPLSSFSLIRVRDQIVEVEQMVGGTRGADYAYIEDERGLLTNIRYISGSRLLLSENWGRHRRREVYSIPLSAIEGRAILYFSYSRSGYMSVEVCRIYSGAISCYLCVNESEVCRSYADRFKVLSGEGSFAEFYRRFTPILVEDVNRVISRTGAKMWFTGHAHRVEEVLENPILSLCTAMTLDTWQGRLLSLQEKLSKLVELWILSLVFEAIDAKALRDELLIEHTTNWPLPIKSNKLGKEFTVFYQPSIYAPIGGGHVVPDIVVYEGVIDRYIGWGKLHKIASKPILLIEVKTGLETTKWASPDYILEQVKSYKDVLQPKHIALAVLTRGDPAVRAGLRALGVEIFENLLDPNNRRAFEDYIARALAYSSS